MTGRKKTVTRKKSSGRRHPLKRSPKGSRSKSEKKIDREMDQYTRFIDEAERRMKENGISSKEVYMYRSQMIQGKEYETIGFSTLALTRKGAEKIAKSIVGYDTIIHPECDGVYRVWTSVNAKDGMPDKPSEKDVAKIRAQFDKFVKNEIVADIDKYRVDGEPKATIKDIGIESYDTTWGSRDGLHAGGSMRGKVNYSHPMLLVHMEYPELIERQISHKANGGKYGVFIEPYDRYTYMVVMEDSL